MSEVQHKEEKYSYFVDGVKYETDQATVTGALIMAKIANYDPSYSLILEGEGGGPDALVTEDTSESLAGEHAPRRFYTVPPAAFG